MPDIHDDQLTTVISDRERGLREEPPPLPTQIANPEPWAVTERQIGCGLGQDELAILRWEDEGGGPRTYYGACADID